MPSVINSVETSKQKAVLKEDIQAISQIVQAGYMNGDFAAITDWSILNTTDPIVQYFTNKLGGVTQQCPMGNVAPPCNIRNATNATSDTHVNHSGRWVMSNSTTLTLIGGGFVDASQILFVINSKPNLDDGVGKQMPVVCNIADTPLSLSWYTTTIPLKPAQCGPWWPPTSINSTYYSLTWEQLFS